MIGPLVALVRELVVTPQTLDAVDVARRLTYIDDGELGTIPAGVDVQAVTTTPARAEIGAGVGMGGPVGMRHVVAVILAVGDLSGTAPDDIRDAIVDDLIARALWADWHNTAAGDNDIERVSVDVSWAPLLDAPVASWATLTFTIDAAWSPTRPV